jgi:hypothetical protein
MMTVEHHTPYKRQRLICQLEDNAFLEIHPFLAQDH